MDTQLLEEIGLTRSESLVYLALCDLGPSTTGKIVEKSGVASSKIYELLSRLENKGLVSHVIKTGTKEFEAAPPERIMLYIEDKERQIKNEKIRAEKFVKLLKSKSVFAKKEQEATIYRGMKSVKTVFYHCLDEMKRGDEMLVMGVPGRQLKINKFFLRLNRRRAEKGIKLKIMFDETASEDLQAIPKNSPLSEIRFMPEGVLTPAAVNIMGENVTIFPAENEDNPLLILIRSKEIAESFRAQFYLLWNQNVKTLYGLEGPRLVLKELTTTKHVNLAFGLSEDKLDKNVPEELAQLIRMQDEGKVKPPRLIFTGQTVKNEVSRVAKIKYLSKKFSTPFHYEIYGDKVAIFYWIDPIITTIIENKTVADNFRRHFETMWKLAKSK